MQALYIYDVGIGLKSSPIAKDRLQQYINAVEEINIIYLCFLRMMLTIRRIYIYIYLYNSIYVYIFISLYNYDL